MLPRISVIIPCYNQGHFLKDVLDSLQQCDQSLFETIIVNDGSTDENTNRICSQLQEEGYHVIQQENKGLAGARNAGLAVAKGDYMLLLDADNKIRPAYITKSIAALDANPQVAVVYGNAAYFGEKSGIWRQGEYNLQRLMISNFIDACAVVRRSVFDEVGFYDGNMKFAGWEDWDLWLRISFSGNAFYYVDEILFDYRVLPNSMSKILYNKYYKPNELENYIHTKYPSKMGHPFIVDHFVRRFKSNPVLFIGKLFLKAYFPGYYNKLLAKNKIRNGI